MDRLEVRPQSTGQGLGHVRIFLKDNNTLKHNSPDSFQPRLMASINARLRLQGWLWEKPQLHRHHV